MARTDNKHSVDITVFDGGLNTMVPAENLPWNQSPSLRAVVFDNYGALKSPAGYQTHNSDSLGNGNGIAGIFSFKPVSMSAQLLAVDESVYVATGVATAFNLIGSSQSIFTAGVDCDIVQFQDLAFFSNGGQQPYKFNGTEFTRAGVSAPSQVLTAVCDAAGSLTGTYEYVFWGVNSYSAEGDYGSPSTAVAIASGNIRVNNIPTAPVSHGITTWKVGRNTAGASGLFWYLTDVANGTTSFTDSVADDDLVTLAPTDQGYLRKFKYMCVYANRLWGAAEDDSILWFSNINQPEEFPSTNFIRVGRGDGLIISAIHPFKGSIIVSKADFNGRTALYQLAIGDSVTFSDPENWNLAKLYDYGGSEAHKACVDYGDYMTLMNRDGIYAFNGAGFVGVANPTQNGAYISSTISENIANRMRVPGVSGKEVYLRYSYAVNWKESLWINNASYTRVSGTGENLFIFDYARISGSNRRGGAWTRLNGQLLMACELLVIHEGNLYGANYDRLSGSYVHQLDTGDLYDSAQDTSDQFQYFTPRIKGRKEHESLFKDFRFVYVTCYGQGTLNIDFSNIGDPIGQDAGTASITLTSTSTRHKIDLASARGKDLQIFFGMHFESGDNVTITRLEIFYNIRGLRS